MSRPRYSSLAATSRPRLIDPPPGSQTTIRVRWHGEGQPEPDDVFVSTGGSLYFVEEARKAGKRWILRCTRIERGTWEGEPDWTLEWDRRG